MCSDVLTIENLFKIHLLCNYAVLVEYVPNKLHYPAVCSIGQR